MNATLCNISHVTFSPSPVDEYGVCFVDTSTAKFHLGQFRDDRQRYDA